MTGILDVYGGVLVLEHYVRWPTEETNEAVTKLRGVLELDEDFVRRDVVICIFNKQVSDVVQHFRLPNLYEASPKLVMYLCDISWHKSVNWHVINIFSFITQLFNELSITENYAAVKIKLAVNH